MAVDASKVRARYIAGMQTAAQKVLELNNILDNLTALHTGAALATTFVDAEIQADVTTQHMDAAFVATVTTNLGTVRTAISNAIAQNLFKAIGKPVG